MEGAGGQYPTLKVFPALFMTMFCINYLIEKKGKNCSYPEKSVSSPQTACHRHENVLLLISICMIKKQ